MNLSRDVQDLFDILHDGSIGELVKINTQIRFKIEIEYLAELINEHHDHLFLFFEKPKTVIFKPWSDEHDSITIFEVISRLELEILSCDIENKTCVLQCTCHESSHGFPGGELIFDFSTFIIKDQDENDITIAHLRNLANQYWNSFDSDAGKNDYSL
ncbi:hypothetical protein PEDI_28970 [Persicobacter diffluens]|uniref:Uncharacterized protein n=2 Tax=Persicobacter diffluens TaxID=981 RepID=A0AAN4W1T3_9BACT|nr:hypothetical protein PEDI_28970 [Persicobacter diffluens]